MNDRQRLSYSVRPVGKNLTSSNKNYEFRSKTQFVSGYVAACTSITILYPLNKLIFRQILEGTSFRQAFVQLCHEGFHNIYRGLLPPLLQKSTSYSIMFGTQHEYYLFLKGLTDSQNSSNELLRSLTLQQRHLLLTGAAGALAGLTEATLTPLERIQAVLQMHQYQNRFKHTWHAFEEISRRHGPRELFRGLNAICLRNSLSNLVFFTSRRRVRAHFPAPTSELQDTFYDFVDGGLIGAFISTVFYPLNVIKSHMQARIGGPHLGPLAALRVIYQLRDRSLRLFYKGVGSNFTRAVLAWGITNCTYEFVLKALSDGKRSAEQH